MERIKINKIIFSNEERQNIIDDYLNGKAPSVIASEFGVDRSTITNRLHKWNIKVRSSLETGRLKSTTEQNKQAIIDKYISGESIGNIAVIYGISYSSIYRLLRAWDIPIRSRLLSFSKHKKQEIIDYYLFHGSAAKTGEYFGVEASSMINKLNQWGVSTKKVRRLPLNDNAFDILTPDTLYWIGYLMADGNVSCREGETPVISVTSSDKEQIEKFARFMKSGHSIYVTNRGLFTLAFRSHKVANRLMSLGVVPKKSLIACVPDNNPDIIFSRDYNRGLIDGDGSLWWKITKGKRYPSLVLTSGSKRLLEQFEIFLLQHDLPVGTTRIDHRKGHNPTYDYRINGKKAVAITNFLYDNSTIHLERKKRIADEFSVRYL
jgi:transposase